MAGVRDREVSLWLLLPGFTWAAALFVAFGFVVEPRPATAGQVAVLFFLCLFLGFVHGGVLALAAAAAGAARRVRGGVRLADAVVALAVGTGYAYCVLSLVKFAVAHSHLRFEDLWFLFTGVRQAAGEATASERAWLAFAALLPLALGVAFFLLLWHARRRGGGLPAPGALALVAAGLAGLSVVAWQYPVARWAAGTLLPDTHAVVSAWRSWRGPDPAAGWQPDPATQARLDVPPATVEPQPWNVVVLMLESIPWRRLVGDQARPATTPNLLALRRDAIDFERAYATSTHSDYAQTSILAGHYPRKTNRHDYFTELDYPRALPWDVARPPRWRTAVFSTQNENWGNMIAFLRRPTLGVLRHAPDFPGAPRRGEGSETKIFEQTAVDAFRDWLAREPGRPFVVYLNFQATHYPYVWPPSFPPPFGPAPIDFDTTFLGYPREEIDTMLDRFHNALAYVDRETGRVVATLQEAGVWERTALLAVADHGEAFYEHGLPTHGTTLLEEQVRVPMFLRLPGAAPRVVREPVSVMDAMPALFAAMGLPPHPAHQGRADVLAPGYSGAGRPLFFSIQGLTREDGLVRDNWKWIVNHDRREAALFDLAADPEERRNLVLEQPERAQELGALGADFLGRQLGYYRAKGWRAGWGPPRVP